MRILNALLVIIGAIILFCLPVTDSIYDFRTDVKEDGVSAPTGAAVTTANVTIAKQIYGADTTTLSVFSSLSTDTPVFSAYSAATKTVLVSGLTANTTRTLTLSYDYDTLTASPALSKILDKLSWILLVCVVGFVPAALAAIFTGRAD